MSEEITYEKLSSLLDKKLEKQKDDLKELFRSKEDCSNLRHTCYITNIEPANRKLWLMTIVAGLIVGGIMRML